MWQITLALYLLLTGVRHLMDHLAIPLWVDGILAILAAILILVGWSGAPWGRTAKAALLFLPLLLFCGCASDSYRRTYAGGTNEVVRFNHKALFTNSKTTKFALDNMTARGTRNGLNFGSNEQDVAVEGINAFFGGLNNLMINAAKLGAMGATGGASGLIPLGGTSPAPHVAAPTFDAVPDPTNRVNRFPPP